MIVDSTVHEIVDSLEVPRVQLIEVCITCAPDALDEALESDDIISVRSLTSGFPADHIGAVLSYAQSYSLVEYLIDEFGWEKMRELLGVFKDGSTPDKALQNVYGFDRDNLGAQWRQLLERR